MQTITYDDSNLQEMFAALSQKRRLQALKGAFRRQANHVKRVAAGNLRGTGVHNADKIARGIRASVFKNTPGFKVTIKSQQANKKTGRGEKSMYKNSRGLKKPVLGWLELGTKKRSTKSQTRIFTRKRKGHSTGTLRQYGFMAKTKTQVDGSVTAGLRKEIVTNVQRVAKKYGCT